MLGHVITLSPRQFANDPECCGLCLPVLYEASQGRVGWYRTVNWEPTYLGTIFTYTIDFYFSFIIRFYSSRCKQRWYLPLNDSYIIMKESSGQLPAAKEMPVGRLLLGLP